MSKKILVSDKTENCQDDSHSFAAGTAVLSSPDGVLRCHPVQDVVMSNKRQNKRQHSIND